MKKVFLVLLIAAGLSVTAFAEAPEFKLSFGAAVCLGRIFHIGESMMIAQAISTGMIQPV
ncbi:hypothetical protein FACS189476_04380 [Spirochaetia bacterium]|nr:hypothetical protein FACS189476_04380 [Spirochaetia bacterium]